MPEYDEERVSHREHAIHQRNLDQSAETERRHAAEISRLNEQWQNKADATYRRFEEERDRRYTEVNIEKEKALKIKETADLAALGLAREIQTYKDEKANQLREQINSERGHYASKDDLAASVGKLEAVIKPIAEYVASNQGRNSGIGAGWATFLSAAALLVSMVIGAVAVYGVMHPHP